MENHLNTNKIPTAEEFYKQTIGCVINHVDIKNAMIEFAKLHVEACKEEYLQKGFGRYMDHAFDKYPTRVPIDEDSILNAYPLENIK